MARRLLLLGLLVVALIAADRALASARAARHADRLAITRLLPEAASSLAALRVETAQGESWLYGQKGGQWRCLTWRSAQADGDAILALASSLLDAVGVPLSADPPQPSDYGLDVPSMLTVSLHGPKATPLDRQRDLLLSVDLGAPLASGTGCFVRLHGERTVWSIDTLPAASLARDAGDRLPPLLDRRLVPATWPDTTPRVQTLRVEPEGAPPFELVLGRREVSQEELITGKPPFEWRLLLDGAPQERAEVLIVYFTDYVVTASWSGLADPALADHLGLDHPRARLVLGAGEAPPLELVLGARLPGGRPVVWNSLTQQLCEISPEQEQRLFPRLEAFSPHAPTNPWEGASSGSKELPVLR